MANLKHPIVLLGVTRKTPVANVILYSRHVCTAVNVNARFVSLTPLVLTLSADTDALEVSEASTLTGAMATVPLRNVHLSTVHVDLEDVRNAVQKLMDTTPAEAASIATSAGMTLRTAMRHAKPPLAARMIGVGLVLLTAKAVARRGVAYEWQYSADGTTWNAVGLSTQARINVPGLTPGTTYSFRFRSTINYATSDWSQVITFMAH